MSPNLTLEMLPWILFAIAVVRLGVTGHRLVEARAQARQAIDRLQTTLAMVEAQAALASLDRDGPRAIRSQRRAARVAHSL